jgi:hypothetical protein
MLSGRAMCPGLLQGPWLPCRDVKGCVGMSVWDDDRKFLETRAVQRTVGWTQRFGQLGKHKVAAWSGSGPCLGNVLILIQHSVPTILVTIIKKMSLHGIGELGIVLNDIDEVREQTEVKETHASQTTSHLYQRTPTTRHMIGKKSSRSKKSS